MSKSKKGKKLVDQNPTDDEEVYFGCWGKEKKKDEQSFVFEENKAYDMKILRVSETDKGFRYIYKAEVEGVDVPVLLFGNTSLNNGMGRGAWDVKTVEPGDEVRVTYKGMYKGKSGRRGYKIQVQVWE